MLPSLETCLHQNKNSTGIHHLWSIVCDPKIVYPLPIILNFLHRQPIKCRLLLVVHLLQLLVVHLPHLLVVLLLQLLVVLLLPLPVILLLHLLVVLFLHLLIILLLHFLIFLLHLPDQNFTKMLLPIAADTEQVRSIDADHRE